MVVKWFCDICGKEIKDEPAYISIRIGDLRPTYLYNKQFCSECATKILAVLEAFKP